VSLCERRLNDEARKEEVRPTVSYPYNLAGDALFGRVEVLKTGDQLRTTTYPSGVPFARLDALPNASFHPFVEPAPTSHATAAAEFARQIFPRCPGLEHKQNSG
jgi:hypothetical protein